MSSNHQIRLAGIADNSLVNGPGLRKVFFSQGCSHHCHNCFNPTTWTFNAGKYVDMDELIATVKNETFLDGVTFSGGDPFQQPEAFAYLGKQLHAAKINIWIYTGYTWEQLLDLAKKDVNVKTMIENCDVIVDGRYMEEYMDDHLKYRGSANQRIINVPESLKQNKLVLCHYDDVPRPKDSDEKQIRYWNETRDK